MDNGPIKSIEAHLASQAREQITELVRNMNPVVTPANPELVDASTMVDAGMQEGQATDEDRELAEERKPLQALAHTTADKVVIENSQSRLYEKFVRDGSESQPDELKAHEDQLLEILDEVDDGVIKTLTSQPQSQNITVARPVPVVNVEFDESMLFDAIEDEQGEEHDDGEAEEYYDDEEAEEHESEDEQSLKETDPGYFHSIVTKI